MAQAGTREPPGADPAALEAQLADQHARYEQFRTDAKALDAPLDMTRGKPCAEQLDLSLPMLSLVGPDAFRAEDGTDCRNYGGVDGLPEAKRLFAAFLDVAPDEVLVGGNASLSLMHDAVARALSHGVPGGRGPWRDEAPKFLCPSPGYDRHFAVCEHLGVEMLVVDDTDDGPDLDRVESLVRDDASVKGIWIVPRYENPTGSTVSDENARRLARMETAAPDFRIFWDNAYAHHHLTDEFRPLANILDACKEAGHPDRVLLFGSTSKISFAGAGLAAMGGSTANVAWMVEHQSYQTIGPDKLNQLRHVRFFRDMDGVRAHMKKHAAIIRPKFELVDRVLEEELGGLGIATWSKPAGGYFISLDTLDGCAKRVVAMAAEAGVKLTAAGATFPYGVDPRDRNIRLAPTLPKPPEIEKAMRVVATCVRIACTEKLVG